MITSFVILKIIMIIVLLITQTVTDTRVLLYSYDLDVTCVIKILLQAKLESYTGVDLSSDGTPEGKADSLVLELKLKALILDTIHNIDVVQILLQANTTSLSDWPWQKQLR